MRATTCACTATISSCFVGSNVLRYAGLMTTDELAAQGRRVRQAAAAVAQATDEQRCAVLRHVADRLESDRDELLAVNAREVAAYKEDGPGRDRLTLTPARVDAMAQALREIADAPDPLFEIVDRDTRPNGLRV